jgi:fused signal recognition particle receptor
MFDFLKKTIKSWVGKKEEKPLKKVTKKKEATKKTKKTQTKAEQQNEQEVDALITQPEEKKEEKKESFFSKLVTKLTTSQLTEEAFEEAFEELEITLLENNTALEAVEAIKASLKKELVGMHCKKSEASQKILAALENAILSILQEPPSFLTQVKTKKPFVILFFGINGTGKTTSIAKVASYLKENKISSVLAAGDTFRAASIEQLEHHAKALNVPCIKGAYEADPASIAFNAIDYAKAHNIQVVLIDTAGRMYTKANLMKEMEKIIRVSKPDLKLFVGESITGNDALDQAQTFNQTAGIDGIILTKADIDKKAGTILSIAQITNKPIYFLGTGQTYKDLLPFTKKTVIKNLGLE